MYILCQVLEQSVKLTKHDGWQGFDYSRSGNPTRSALERLLTSLETAPLSDAQGESFVFSSGSAATAAMAHWVALAKKEGGAGGANGNGGGGHVLAVNDVVSGFSGIAPDH